MGRRTLLAGSALLLVAVVALVAQKSDAHPQSVHSSKAKEHRILSVAEMGASVPSSARVVLAHTTRTGQITILPAPAQMLPKIPESAALEVWNGMHRAPRTEPTMKVPAHPTVVEFGLLTDRTMGTLAGGTKIEPFYVNYPVWIIIYRHAIVVAGGDYHAGGPRASSRTSLLTVGNMYGFVSATTGQSLFTSASTTYLHPTSAGA